MYWFSLVRFDKDTAGGVTGLITPTQHVGSIVAPFIFGLIVGGFRILGCLALALVISDVFTMLAGNRRIVTL